MLSVLEKPLVRLPVYLGFGFIVFLIAVAATFPDDQIKDIVAVQIEKQLGGKYSVEIGDLDIWLLSGVALENVTIEERVDPSDVPAPAPEGEDPEAELPMRVTIPSIAGRLAPMRSIVAGPTVAFEVDVGGGIIDGFFSNGSDERALTVNLNAIDLRKTLALTAFLGIPFFGELDGTVDLKLHPKTPTITAGSIVLNGDKLTLGPATVKTDKFPPITYLEIPQTNFGSLDVNLTVEPSKGKGKDMMNVEAFKWSGRDIRGEIWGKLQLASRVEQTQPDVEMRMQLDENFVSKNSLGPLLNVAEVRRGKNKDWFGFQLYGKLKNLKFKGSPKAANGPPAGATSPTTADEEEG